MSASVRDQMPKPSCVSCQLGSPTTTTFTRTRLSDIVHRVSSSQLMQDPDCVRSFGGYNTLWEIGKGLGNVGARKAPPSGLGVERRDRSKRVTTPLPPARGGDWYDAQ